MSKQKFDADQPTPEPCSEETTACAGTASVSTAFTRVDPRVEEACEEIAAALKILEGHEGEERLQMDVCLATRTAEAKFLAIARWSGEFSETSTEVARRLLLGQLELASKALYSCKSAYYTSVSNRLNRITSFQVSASS